MKKLIFILFLFIFASSASATVYKWVDEGGVVNFTDDYGKIPPTYRESVEQVSTPKMERRAPSPAPPGKIAANAQSTGTAAQAPPIAQTLIREGDFAIKLAEILKIGQAKSEAEAENMLASVGIAPRNGWIADYPMTPDIIGELQNAVGGAVDSGKLAMKKDEAMKVFQDLVAQQGIPVRPDERQYAGAEPPVEPPRDYGEYSRSEVINNYYYNEGPPIVTYSPPPWDYYYLYSWVPYPFWCSGFWFPGFFCLRDFHRFVFVHGRRGIISNHFIDPKTRGVAPIDPATRGTGRPHHTLADASQRRGFTSPEAKRGAESIFGRSHERARPGDFISSGAKGAPGGQIPSNRNSNTSTLRGRVGTQRQPTASYWVGRSQAGVGSRNMGSGSFGYQRGLGNRSGMTFPRSFAPSTGGSSFGGFHGGGGFGRSGSLGGGRGGHWSR